MLAIARKEGLHTEQMAGEIMIYDVTRHKAHCLSPAAAIVWGNCNGERTAEDLAAEVRKSGINADEELVWMILHRLNRLNLLQEKLTIPDDAILSSRRAIIKKVAAVGGMLLLLTATITAPTPAQARSGGHPHKPPHHHDKD